MVVRWTPYRSRRWLLIEATAVALFAVASVIDTITEGNSHKPARGPAPFDPVAVGDSDGIVGDGAIFSSSPLPSASDGIVAPRLVRSTLLPLPMKGFVFGSTSTIIALL